MENRIDEFRKSPRPRLFFPRQYSQSSACLSEFPGHCYHISHSCAISTEDLSRLRKSEPDTVDNKVIGITRVSTESSTSGFACAALGTRRNCLHTRQSDGRRHAERYQESTRLDPFRREIANRGDDGLSCCLSKCHTARDVRAANEHVSLQHNESTLGHWECSYIVVESQWEVWPCVETSFEDSDDLAFCEKSLVHALSIVAGNS